MSGRYQDALDVQARWLGWMQSPRGMSLWLQMYQLGGDAASVKDASRMHSDGRYITEQEQAFFATPLKHGDVYYVGKEFCRLVEHARESLPDATFDPRLLLSRVGFVYFETPFEMPLTSERRQRDLQRKHNDTAFVGRDRILIRAFGWVPILAKRKDEPQGSETERVEFVMYEEPDDYPKGSIGELATGYFWPVAFFAMKSGEVLSIRMKEFEGVADAQDDGSRYVWNADEIWRHEMRLVYTLLLLANQRVAKVKHGPLDRATRRRFERETGSEPPEHVKVITLRRYDERAKVAEPGEVDWQYQWDVRGHWRWQWYPSLGYHQSIWIEPFTKGPPDRPFKADQRRVFAVVR